MTIRNEESSTDEDKEMLLPPPPLRDLELDLLKESLIFALNLFTESRVRTNNNGLASYLRVTALEVAASSFSELVSLLMMFCHVIASSKMGLSFCPP